MTPPTTGPDAGADHFEARFQADPDPWGYTSSSYETTKYRHTLEACGPGPFPRALELGAAIGVFSALLADRCAALTTVDFSPTAVALARERLSGATNVRVVEGAVPDAVLDEEPFDLVVASEILYYLPDDDFRRTVERLPVLLRDGARLVAVHWTGRAPDLARSAEETHRALRSCGLRHVAGAVAPHSRAYLLDAFDA